MATERKAKSPYQRYKKTPYRYSVELRAWQAAVRKGDKAEIERTSRAHARRFAPWAA